MRRRDLLISLSLAACSPPASAQQSERTCRLVILNLTLPASELTEAGPYPQYKAFFRELRRLGYDEGRNLSVFRLFC